MRIANVEAKTIFGIIGAIAVVVAITYFSEWILFLPALIGLLILIKFGKDEVSKFVGFLTLKPIASMFLVFVARLEIFERFPHFSNEVVLAVLWIVPELPLTLVVVRVYRQLFNGDKIVWLFLIGDIIRWVSLTIEALLPDPFPEPYFYMQLYVFAFFAIFYPSLYSIGGLITVIRRTNSHKTVLLSGSQS